MSDSVAYVGTSSLLSYIYDAQLNMNRYAVIGIYFKLNGTFEMVSLT